MRAAALWAAASTLAAFPRLAGWAERPKALWFLVVVLALSSFVLWAFVFAWLPQMQPHRRLPFPRRPADWMLATAVGLVGAGFLAGCIDPELRRLMPEDYPASLKAWIASTLFTLGFVQLFLCFAPFAFFLRLLRRPRWAALGTIGFSAFLLLRQLDLTPAPLAPLFIALLMAARLLIACVALVLLWRGGPLLVWWIALLLQARLLPLVIGQ